MLKQAGQFVRRGAGVLVGGVIVSAPAFATVDVTSVTSTISDAVTAGATVGAAALAMFIGFKVWKWIRGAAG